MEVMLKEYIQQGDCEYKIPHDLDAYLHVDDADLDVHLRSQSAPIAKKIVDFDIHKVAFERHGPPKEVDLFNREMALREANIPVYSLTMHGSSFSKMKTGQSPIYVLGSAIEGTESEPLYSLSSAFEQAKFIASISRLFVPSEYIEPARELMDKMSTYPVQQSLL